MEMDHVSFVKSVEIAEPKIKLFGGPSEDTKQELPTDYKEEGYVVAGSLVAFTENVTGQAKSDILNSLLLAQLASDKKYNREVNTDQWYDMYKLVMGKVGFVIQAFSFFKYKSSGASFKMDAAVLEIIAAAATGNELAVMKKTLDALKGLKDDDNRIKVFDSHGSSKEGGNFQCGPCTQGKNGDVAVSIGAFHFKSSGHSGSFLFFHWSSSKTTMYRGTQSAVLNVEVYSQVREAIVQKLGTNAVNFILNLEI